MSSAANASARPAMEPPRGAAIAGVIFSVLTIVGIGLVRYAIPIDPAKPGEWLTEPVYRDAVRLALRVVPFAGIAFLWFLGVLRSRVGELEDQFFASVFLGSGLLFVASIFVATAVMSALIESVGATVDSETYYFGRSLSDALFNIFAVKMAGVFIISTCTIGLRTAIVPRWIAFVGYGCAALLLLVIANWRWITLVFPLWMLLVSVHILVAEFRFHRTRQLSPQQSD